jgi:hypothetical protein
MGHGVGSEEDHLDAEMANAYAKITGPRHWKGRLIMAVYAPNKFPADRLTFTAGATITEGQLVYISAANTVSPTSRRPAPGSAWRHSPAPAATR